ncbi:unnamed protein product [Vitrella brassicaformis CCMP3155]|uniref:Uncharacterized protein n=1 Tax=Vitrella brassicaformis (strain CCMP3155) TaxID=1169540 RepID=A0A0G4GX05_VITBC|nr:unnamed protein product [Vitrella brassicaformis CCMP3155]|eukprot:CEM35581.1 unnamed protein product [Vitrella brassicaformis CCMP3155]
MEEAASSAASNGASDPDSAANADSAATEAAFQAIRSASDGHDDEAEPSSGGGDDDTTKYSDVVEATFRALRLHGLTTDLPAPRELHIPVYALANAVWDLPPPLPSPLTGAVLAHHPHVIIDCINPEQRRFWEQLTPQTARDLGRQMINLQTITH